MNKSKIKIFYKLAFTLAEVLIVLGIIGIVAEMTIPTLMNNVQQQLYVSQLKKVYSTLAQAALLIKNDNGGTLVQEWADYGHIFCVSDDTCMMQTFAKYVRATKVCNTGQYDDTCWHKNGNWFTETNAGMGSCDGCSVLQSPAGFWMTNSSIDVIDYNCNSTITDGPQKICFGLLVDVNGAQRPNRIGYDIHRLYITEDGISPPTAGTTFDMIMKK